MKKIYVVITFAIFLFTGQIMANSANLFDYDAQALENEFTELSELENYVTENAGVTLTDIQTTQTNLLTNLNLNVESPFKPMFTIDDMDWGAFAWGFCCGACGVLIVYLQKDKRTNERMVSSLIGWGISVIVGVIANFASGGYSSYY